MNMLLGIVIGVFLAGIFSMFAYTVIQDIFNFIISPRINDRLDERVSALYQMGLYESADIVKLRFLRRWMDLLWMGLYESADIVKLRFLRRWMDLL